jgi:serine/threonine protein kinase
LSDSEQREIYVRDACQGDPALRTRVEQLLRAAAGAESLFSGNETDPAAAPRETIRLEPTPEEGPGTVVGRYKLLQKVGEGGMGVVYMAEQTEPVTRKVALKIIKLGMDTKQVVARFEAERQALAMMDHPNIAKVLDAGATGAPVAQASPPASSTAIPPVDGPGGQTPPEPAGGDALATLSAGRPYFVMELVRGVPITEYCDKNKLSTEERLNLFIPVCQAIQHAHQKGIIHREIKPSNVMVTLHDGNPVPKVIDFGIAKAANQKLTEMTLFTHYSQMIGTPAYMSPEQAEMSGLDVDTRTDVYSLGVLLYELLTGSTPFPSKELLSMGYGEMQKVIAEKEPPKPSTRLSTMQNEERSVLARNRSMEASALSKVFQGDLDWIVMKSLEKDRTHRYETVNGLVADIQRHLNDEPVSATARGRSTTCH